MSPPSVPQLLNRLLAIIHRSFPQFLQFSRPYVPPGCENLAKTLAVLVAEQNAIAARISRLIIAEQALPRSGEFPMEYTDMHDLSLDFLLQRATDYQQQDIQAIGALIEQLPHAPAAKSLAEEALGMAKGHLESLRELVEQRTPTP